MQEHRQRDSGYSQLGGSLEIERIEMREVKGGTLHSGYKKHRECPPERAGEIRPKIG
jgi:hypothetical protein